MVHSVLPADEGHRNCVVDTFSGIVPGVWNASQARLERGDKRVLFVRVSYS